MCIFNVDTPKTLLKNPNPPPVHNNNWLQNYHDKASLHLTLTNDVVPKQSKAIDYRDINQTLRFNEIYNN